MLAPSDFFELDSFGHAAIFEGVEYAWEVISRIAPYLEEHLEGVDAPLFGDGCRIAPGAVIEGAVIIGSGTVVEHGALIRGPAIIGSKCQVRQGAYVRGDALVGDRCVIGHATEMKNAVMLNDAKAPHFNYVADSVMGNDSNIGAGTKLSNLTMTSYKDAGGRRPTLKLKIEGQVYDTGLAKFGCIMGDGAQTGCNSVLNPGCILGKRTVVYANVSLRAGYYPPGKLIKLRQQIEMADLR